MNARWNPKITVCLVLLAWSLAACAAEEPRLIGSYPVQQETRTLAVLPRGIAQPGIQFVYETWLELEVSRVTSTAEKVVDLTALHGGYLESSNSWLEDGRTHMTLVLEVPAAGYDGLREDLLDLGTLQQEQLHGEWVNSPRDWPYFAHISLTLLPRSVAWPDWSVSGWNPGRTFRQALDVFISIFGFLVDILIWVGVVLGPFVLIALGLWALWRRLH